MPGKDKWEQFAEPSASASASGDKWEQFAEPTNKAASSPTDALSKTTGIGPGPGWIGRKWNEVKAGFDASAPGSGLPRQPTALGNAAQLAGVVGQEGAFLSSAPGAVEAKVPALAMNVASRGATALTGAHYGGRMASEVGLPPWVGQAVGGATGFFAPEALSKLSGPLISRIAAVLGRSAPEVATVIAEDTSLAKSVGRDIVERAAHGAPLSEEEEQMLLKQVQKHYTPDAGVESAARKAGKIYAGRGTSLRPTNEQIAISKMTPPPEP
jgi:hypothetical protein